jgi:hypothetical protein
MLLLHDLTMPRGRRLAIGLLAAAAGFGQPLAAQGVIISGVSSAQYLELRPLALDSIPYANTTEAWGIYRLTPGGIPANCPSPSGSCTYFRSSNQQSLMAVMQDLDVTAWGLGQGISVHAELRGRTAAGGGRELWPQAAQRVEALAAYVDVDRSLGRARLGRQWIASTLGVFNFDGAALSLNPMHGISGQVYGGNALVEGLNRVLDAGVLSPVEDIPPADAAYVIGTTVAFRPSAGAAVTAQYQREIRHDRAGLYSERVAATGEMQAGATTLSGVLSRDLATSTFNELSGTIRRPIANVLDASVTARHYAPYFDLWTIWGAFSPVAYDEFMGRLGWASRDARVVLGATGARRRYDDTFTGVAHLPLRTDGWRAGTNATFRATPAVSVFGAYTIDIGPGASSADGDAAVQWMRPNGTRFALHGTAFQNVGEYQIGHGTVYGLGGEAAMRIAPGLQLAGDLFVYRHTAHDQPQLVDWNQRRASVRLEWTLGGEPSWGGAIGKARGDAP